MKKLIHVTVCTALALGLFMSGSPAYAASVGISLPRFNVTLNGTQIDNAARQYPLIVYKDITYFPMTYYDCRFLGLESKWDPPTGLDIKKTGVNDGFYNEYETTGRNPQSATAQTVSFPIHVNGKSVDNSKEEYPLLLYKDITYFSLTWRFAVDEFGWEYSFDGTRGLTINSTSANSIPPVSDSSTAGQTLTTVGWSSVVDDNGVSTSTSLVLNFSGWPLSFSASDLSNMKLTRDGKEIDFSFSGNVEQQPLSGSGVPQTGFHIELSKPLTEQGVYVMTGVYKGTTFTTDALVVGIDGILP